MGTRLVTLWYSLLVGLGLVFSHSYRRAAEMLLCRGVAQLGRAPALGAGGRMFESCRLDHFWFRG